MSSVEVKYNLQVGTVVDFTEEGRLNYKNRGSSAWRADNSFWITQIESDRKKVWFRRINHVFSVINGRLIEQTKPRQKIGYFHLSDNGSVIYNTKISTDFDPQEIFPALPPNLTPTALWKAKNPLLEKNFEYTMKSSAQDYLTFESKFEGPIDRIHSRTTTQTIRFDLKKSLPVEITTHVSEEYPIVSTKESTVKLNNITTIDEQTCLAIEKEFQLCLDATLEYEVFCNKLDKISTNVQELIEKASDILVSTNKKLNLDLTREILEGFIQMHESNVDHMKWDFAEIIETKGMQLAPWQLRCFEDEEKIVNSADLIGKVVVLDFWHRDCSYCIKMMPRMKAIVDQFQNEMQQEKLVIFGVNVDSKQSDAMIVLDNMKLNYQNLIGSKKFATKCFVRSYPTIYVFSKQGMIKDVYKGAHVDFENEMTISIRNLLQANES